MNTSPITTHVLDLSLGRPAQGVAVVLSTRAADGRWHDLARGATDADGRLHHLLPAGTPVPAGTYRLRFDTAAYFRALGKRTFYPEVAVTFEVDDPPAHYHVPLLLSPFGYSTYRGS
jgi:5-hydroxyisourate hydrolase